MKKRLDESGKKCYYKNYDVMQPKEAMRKAEAAGNKDCPVKIKLVAPPAYVLNTQTLDKGMIFISRRGLDDRRPKGIALRITIGPEGSFEIKIKAVNGGETTLIDRQIMGLNPPFGVKSALANKFIDKALKFKPKLIALIVPLESERLDKKDPPYDLVFEDSELLAVLLFAGIC
ncbi:hypothetical protein OROMI_004014 [Orobanche minor]